MIFMFTYDVVCCRDGIIKPYLRGDATEVIIEDVGYKLVVDDVIMGAVASQITSLTIAYSTVYSDANQRKHKSSVSLNFCGEFTGDR